MRSSRSSASCFANPWTRDMFLDELERTESTIVATSSSGMARSSASAASWWWPRMAHVMNLAVRADARRRGLGSALLSELCSRAAQRGATRMTLEVREGNRAARALYEEAGSSRSGSGAATTPRAASTPSSCGPTSSTIRESMHAWRSSTAAGSRRPRGRSMRPARDRRRRRARPGHRDLVRRDGRGGHARRPRGAVLASWRARSTSTRDSVASCPRSPRASTRRRSWLSWTRR